jgi:hypothetical protein
MYFVPNAIALYIFKRSLVTPEQKAPLPGEHTEDLRNGVNVAWVLTTAEAVTMAETVANAKTVTTSEAVSTTEAVSPSRFVTDLDRVVNLSLPSVQQATTTEASPENSEQLGRQQQDQLGQQDQQDQLGPTEGSMAVPTAENLAENPERVKSRPHHPGIDFTKLHFGPILFGHIFILKFWTNFHPKIQQI